MNCGKDHNSATLAQTIREHTLRMVHKAKASHVGSCLSIADILAVLYGRIMCIDPTNPEWAKRDRFLLSKGHCAAIFYALLAELGFFPAQWLDDYCGNGSKLGGHVTYGVPGVELSTGSLGHALPVGIGMALAAKSELENHKIFIALSDGELNEGSNWEAILFAPQHYLDNIVVIVDYNKIQAFGHTKDVLDLEPLTEKFRAFKWTVKEVDGHNHEEIEDVLKTVPFKKGSPSVIIAHTIKGKGVSFMENQLSWHYKSPDAEQLKQALNELRDNS